MGFLLRTAQLRFRFEKLESRRLFAREMRTKRDERRNAPCVPSSLKFEKNVIT